MLTEESEADCSGLVAAAAPAPAAAVADAAVADADDVNDDDAAALCAAGVTGTASSA